MSPEQDPELIELVLDHPGASETDGALAVESSKPILTDCAPLNSTRCCQSSAVAPMEACVIVEGVSKSSKNSIELLESTTLISSTVSPSLASKDPP